MIRDAAIIMFAAAAAAAPAAAQTTQTTQTVITTQASVRSTRTLPAELRDGRRALSFGAFVDGGGMIGLTFMMTPRTAFTLDVQGDARIVAVETTQDEAVVDERDQLDLEILLAPGFRRYMAGRGDVASYIAGRLLLGFEAGIDDNGTSRVEQYAPIGGAALGFGLEWFITEAMSLRGEAALEGTYRRAASSGPTDAQETVSEAIDLGLGQSGLAISIWF